MFSYSIQDDFIVWEGEPTARGKDRHLFLFKNKLLITKKKKAEDFGELPTYEFRSVIEVHNVNFLKNLISYNCILLFKVHGTNYIP